MTTVNDLYEKCIDCHLFVDLNDASGPDVELYIHLHRGDEADEKIDESHVARPSGLRAPLNVWRAYGPLEMRKRFDP